MAKARKAKVFLADRAIADLQEIELASNEKWGKAQTAKYLDAFDRLFSLLEAEPGILSPTPLVDSLLTHTVESHVVVCTKWNDDVLVLTVVHASRDLITHMDRLLPTLQSEVASLKSRLP